MAFLLAISFLLYSSQSGWLFCWFWKGMDGFLLSKNCFDFSLPYTKVPFPIKLLNVISSHYNYWIQEFVSWLKFLTLIPLISAGHVLRLHTHTNYTQCTHFSLIQELPKNKLFNQNKLWKLEKSSLLSEEEEKQRTRKDSKRRWRNWNKN